MAEHGEIKQPDNPEIEQKEYPEFEQSTEHPQGDDTRIQSEKIRYENADSIYET